MMIKIILIPGMGCTPIESSNWYGWFRDEMQQRTNVQCTLDKFPDPYQCRESIWVPYVRDTLMKHVTPDQTILIGHSSGAACAMRLLEQFGGPSNSNTPLAGCILISAAYTDLNDETERASEYFNRPWNWQAIRQGARQLVLFHGTDDHLIPVSEAQYIASQLGDDAVDYRERDGMSHFFYPFPELLEVIDQMLSQQS